MKGLMVVIVWSACVTFAGCAAPIWQAVNRGETATVERLLAAGADPNYELAGGNGTTVLHVAAALGHLQVVELLLAKGAAIDPTTSSAALRAAMVGIVNSPPALASSVELEIGPGTFDVGADGLRIDVGWVHVHGSGRSTTRIVSNVASAFTVRVGADVTAPVELRALTIEGASAVDAALLFEANSSARVVDVAIENHSAIADAYGVRCLAGASPTLENVAVAVTGGTEQSTGIAVGTGAAIITRSEVRVAGTGATWAQGIEVTGSPITRIADTAVVATCTACLAVGVYASGANVAVDRANIVAQAGSQDAVGLWATDNPSGWVALSQTYLEASNAVAHAGCALRCTGWTQVELRGCTLNAFGSGTNVAAEIATDGNLKASQSILRSAGSGNAINAISGTVFAAASEIGGTVTGAGTFNCLGSWNKVGVAVSSNCLPP